MKELYKNEFVAKATYEMLASWNEGDEAKIQAAAEKWSNAIFEQMVHEYEQLDGDSRALASRGYRRLTTEETEFYNALAKHLESPQASGYTDALDGIPTTVINDVYTNLVNEHPLLNAITFRNVGYSTKVILNSHSSSSASWGPVNSTISQAITSSFKVISLTLSKLSCYAVLPLDMLRMGAQFLDNYIRTVLTEAMATALEAAVVSGDGNGKPIGMDRKLDAQAVITDYAYAKKTAVALTEFTPEAYGDLIGSKLLTADNGVYKSSMNGLGIACNPVDYYKLIMPATTVMNGVGQYVGDRFPVPTKVFPSAALQSGDAILGFMPEYTLGIGSSRTGNIEASDEFKFLDDMRTFKTIMFANGRAFDNSSFVLLDISGLEPAYVPIKSVEGATGGTTGGTTGGSTGTTA